MINQEPDLSRKFFDFLVHEHQFKYEGYQHAWTTYSSDKMVIRVFEGRATPSVVLRIKKEPDFTETNLDTVMESLGKMTSTSWHKWDFGIG